MLRAVKKEYGQHFLADRNILSVIDRLAALSPGDTVLEIGPGQGVLTRYLAERVGRVHAVEINGGTTIDADVVALGYGFASSSELARALGCAHRFVARGSGSMETVTDAEGRTSLGDVFAIGDGARFGFSVGV